MSVEGGCNVSRSVATAATFWLALAMPPPPSWLVVGVTPLAGAQMVVRSSIRILSASSMGLCCGSSYG
jgi:hypothetical protein